jgi:hypothetical protein
MGKMRKTRYMAGWEVYFEYKKETIDFLTIHGVDEEGFLFFKEAQLALEFEIEGNKIINGYRHRQDSKELEWENIDLPIDDWEDHQVFLLEKDPQGVHQIGGSMPEGLTLPTHSELTSPFQYIGTLDGRDPFLEWLNMEKLHIVFPIYDVSDGVYLDYSNPLQPKIVGPSTFYGGADVEHQIEFSQVNFRATRELDVIKYKNGDALLGGVPLWFQFPHVPKCPVTNKPMRFICSIGSHTNSKVVKGVEHVRNNHLIFGDMSHLMLFYSTESKILFARIEP